LKLHSGNRNFSCFTVKFVRFKSEEDIRKNAVSAGVDNIGRTVYVGLGKVDVSNNEPGPIYLNNPPQFFWCNAGSEHYTENMNVVTYLTKDQDCDFEWVRSQHGQYVEHANMGVWHGQNIYFARYYHNGLLRVGKVGTISPNNRMLFAYAGTEIITNKNYEVLQCIPNDRTSKSCEGKTTENQKLKDDIASLKKSLNETQESNAQLNIKVNTVQAENVKFTTENENLKSQVGSLNETVAKLNEIISHFIVTV
jgi:hypothetical protein